MSNPDRRYGASQPPARHVPQRLPPAESPVDRQAGRPRGQIYAPAPAGARPLRVGILLNGFIHERWVAWMLDGIAASGAAEIVCLVRYEVAGQVGDTSPRSHALYSRLDALLAARRLTSPDPSALIDLSQRFDGVNVLSGRAPRRPDGCELTDPCLSLVRQQALDVILALGPDIWAGPMLSVARFGVWSHSWDGQAAERGEAAAFWAVNDARPTMRCELSILGQPAGASRVIARSEVPVYPRSPHLTRRKLHAAAADLVPRCLRQFRSRGNDVLAEVPQDMDMRAREAKTHERSLPTTIELLQFLPRLALRWLCFRWQYRFGEWWFLALRRRPERFLQEGSDGDRLGGFVPLPAAPGHYYADPFLLEESGATHLFFEDFDKSRGRAHISHALLSPEGMPSAPRPVLERPYHLSYPFVFRWHGQIFMLPETGQNCTVELYRCQDFPQSWILERVMLEGWRATDATLHLAEDGQWWMFVNIDERGGGCSALFLFQAATPFGPWQPHPQNPVQTDPRHLRPAGRLFRREGKLLRPAQDSSSRYGGGLWLMEVKELTAENYREQPFLRFGPEWLEGNLCLHHRDATERFEVIDGMRLSPARAQ